jgi:hypothetical protein
LFVLGPGDVAPIVPHASLRSTVVTAPALPQLPPRSATEIVDGAVQLIRPHFGYFLRIAAIGAIPSLLLSIVTLALFPDTPTDPTAQLVQQVPQGLLAWIFGLVQAGAVIVAGLAVLMADPTPTVWGAFAAAGRRLFALIGSSLLLIAALLLVAVPIVAVFAFLLVSGGTTLAALSSGGTAAVIGAVLAAIVILFVFFFAVLIALSYSQIMTALVIIERHGPVTALRRAHALSSGSYMHLVKTYGLVMLITGVVYAVMAGIAAAFQGQQQIAQAIVGVLIIPVVPILGSITLLTYADLRVRREGADLDAALESLTTPMPPVPFTPG